MKNTNDKAVTDYPIKIAFEAKALFRSMDGIARYSRQLYKALHSLNVTMALYTPQKTNNPSVKILEQTHKKNQSIYQKILDTIYFNLFLPRLVKKDNCPVFLGTSHRFPLLLSKKIARVVVIHDLVWLRHKKSMPLLNWLADKILTPISIKRADRIIVVSNSTKNDLIRQFPELSDKVRVTYLSASHFNPVNNPSNLIKRGIKQPYILFVGNGPRKNLARLIEAFSYLSHQLKDRYQLVVVSSQRKGNTNTQMIARRFNVESSVINIGYVSDSELAWLYSHAYFLSMPSLYEGFGLPIVEANAHGVPVLTSNNSAMPEVGGDAAFLVDPLDVNSIYQGLNKLLTNSELREQLVNKSKNNALRFSWEKTANQTLRVLEEAINARHEIRQTK